MPKKELDSLNINLKKQYKIEIHGAKKIIAQLRKDKKYLEGLFRISIRFHRHKDPFFTKSVLYGKETIRIRAKKSEFYVFPQYCSLCKSERVYQFIYAIIAVISYSEGHFRKEYEYEAKHWDELKNNKEKLNKLRKEENEFIHKTVKKIFPLKNIAWMRIRRKGHTERILLDLSDSKQVCKLFETYLSGFNLKESHLNLIERSLELNKNNPDLVKLMAKSNKLLSAPVTKVKTDCLVCGKICVAESKEANGIGFLSRWTCCEEHAQLADKLDNLPPNKKCYDCGIKLTEKNICGSTTDYKTKTRQDYCRDCFTKPVLKSEKKTKGDV